MALGEAIEFRFAVITRDGAFHWRGDLIEVTGFVNGPAFFVCIQVNA